MLELNDIIGLLVTLAIDEEQTLFIMLGADGHINRLGTGAIDNTEHDLFIGKVPPEAFEKLRSQITEQLLQWIGTYSDPTPKGKICKLSIGFQLSSGQELMSHWRYGSESQGPPPEMCKFVITTVETTNPWYEEQKAIAKKEM